MVWPYTDTLDRNHILLSLSPELNEKQTKKMVQQHISTAMLNLMRKLTAWAIIQLQNYIAMYRQKAFHVLNVYMMEDSKSTFFSKILLDAD